MKPNNIRPIAICVFKDGERIFIAESFDPAKKQTFYRPLGGAIEFGERGAAAVVREVWEEVRLEVEKVRYLGALENIFTYNEEAGHEIVLVYTGEFTDRTMYQKVWMTGQEGDGAFFKAMWMNLNEFGPDAPLYPEGLLEMLRAGPA